MKMKLLLGVAAMLFAAQSASASMILILDDTSTGAIDTVIIDNSVIGTISDTGEWTTNALDTIGATDVIGFDGMVGGFNVVTTTGVSSQGIGQNAIALDSLSISGGTGGSIDILLIDTDFVDNGLDFLSQAQVLFGPGSVFFQTAASASNSEGQDLGSAIGAGGFSFLEAGTTVTAGNPAFSYDGNAVPGSAAYSMAIFARVTHSGSGITQFSASLSQVPEPGTLAIWSVLGAAGLVIRRRRG